jgi:uncharacterized membrane protein (UPF0127 family)
MAEIVMNRTKTLPALLLLVCTLFMGVGCAQPQAIVDGKIDVEVGNETFSCIIVADNDSRTVGLGNHPGLGRNDAMLFSFPDSKVRSFLMRDCTFDIDIIFLDPTGRITAMHAMLVEDPKGDNESQFQYEMRLKKYSSRFNAQYAIEFAGGTLERLNLSMGDQIELNIDALQAITE